MTLFISNDDARALVTMADAVAALDAGFKEWGTAGFSSSRQRLPLPSGKSFNYMAGRAGDSFGTKGYFGLPSGAANHVTLYSISQGKLLAIMESRVLSELRTGAASGVASKYLARDNAATVGVVGAGRQGRTQLMAICAVRKIKRAQVYSRTEATRRKFADEVSRELGIEIVATTTARAAVEGTDIVIAATHGDEPVVFGDWLQPGVHVNAIGANNANQKELDDAAVLKSDLIVVDDRAQSMIEAGELIDLAKAGKLRWDQCIELGDVVSGKAKGRAGDRQITLFNSLGIGLEDVAFGRMIYDRAVAQGRGRKLDIP